MNDYAVVFLLRPPYLLRREAFFERKHAYQTKENGVRTGCAAIVNHCVIVNLLRRVNLLRHSIFSMAGSFGEFNISPPRTSLRHTKNTWNYLK